MNASNDPDQTPAGPPEESARLSAAAGDITADASSENDDLLRFGISMQGALVRELDAWRKQQGYASRSEAVRDMVRDALVETRWQDENADPTEKMVGVVTIVYQHSVRQLSEHLTQVQHEHHDTAHAALHIHLSADYCLEVIVLKGQRSEVLHMAKHLISARGVLHGKFIPTTTGDQMVQGHHEHRQDA